MKIQGKSIYEKLNDLNQEDYSNKTNGDFRRQIDKDITYDKMTRTDWKSESKYHNTCHGKPIGNAIKMKNKEWHKLTKNKYAKGI